MISWGILDDDDDDDDNADEDHTQCCNYNDNREKIFFCRREGGKTTG